ncbi:MAG: glycogen debranching protein GlgX [Spirochaetales bacterium]|nr:glycogen debranching protein GlgX [Spirochaetales bacterium]
MEVWPGNPYPLGATFDGAGTNFSIFSEIAEKIELCLFDKQEREIRVPMPEVTGGCWHAYIPTIYPGQMYGYRVYGPWEPHNGLLCNPSKLLLDPYAKAIKGAIRWNDAIFPFLAENGINEKDSAPFVPKGVVINPYFDWTEDHKPRLPWSEMIVYEVHVKGFSYLNTEIPSEISGTFNALCHPVSIEYFKKLGITAIELMPIHQFIHDGHLKEKGLRNYWGYNTLSFFSPHNEYAMHEDPVIRITEFKNMVKLLHKEGIEVILDVVYNHTAEGNHLGPMLSFKGIDNSAYYRLSPEDAGYYIDYTGTGNSLNMRNPAVLRLIMDSLRYWVEEMHVDGFRFDLASALARELHDVDKLSAFFDVIQQDPVISQVKLIAEPWDVGEGGYQVGNFPTGWSEWNGKYRDCIRDFWRGTDETLNEFAYRITGSSDLYENTSRLPFASINFITCHDGFTLHDLVSYNEKHNEANGEDNRDGENENRSWNCGVEGETDDTDIIALRNRQKRNLLTTLMLSQGVPMLLGGDEISRTQGGNNNAYCQDNDITWFHWDKKDEELLDFTTRLIRFRQDHPVFRRRHWFKGRFIHGSNVEDIGWFTIAGDEMEENHWGEGFAKSIGVFLNGKAISRQDERGRPIVDDSFYLLFNSHHEPLPFILPDKTWGRVWKVVLDTARGWMNREITLKARGKIDVKDRSLVVLQKKE